MSELLDRHQVAERLHVSRSTVWRLGKSGAITEVQVGKRAVRVTSDSVEQLIESGALIRSDASPAPAGGV